MAQRIDRSAGLLDGLLANRPSMSPLQREVLQQQHPRLVGGVIERPIGDVAPHTERVEPEVDRCVQVASDHLWSCICRTGCGREQVGALEEDSLAVDRTDPVVPHELSETGAALAAIADLIVDDDFDGHFDQRLFAERPRPPQGRIADVDRPLEVVPTGGDRLMLFVDLITVDVGTHRHRREPVAVETGGDAQVCPPRIGVATQHPQTVDAHRPGVEQDHRAPQAAWIEARADSGGGLEDAGDVASTGRVRLR